MKRTFVDSGVLIAAARGSDSIARQAMQVLDDPEREFASSAFVELEVLPKAEYHKRRAEVQFYEEFFREVKYRADVQQALLAQAREQARSHGLDCIDALHVAAALSVHAEELVTTEKPEKPIHRVTGLRIVSIRGPDPA